MEALEQINRSTYVHGTRIRWTGANPQGWTGEGYGRVVSYENARSFFHGGEIHNGVPTGPAVEIELDDPKAEEEKREPRRHRVFVAPSELSVLS